MFFLCALLLIPQTIDPSTRTRIVIDTTLNDGWIILNGVLLSKPYRLYIRNDTFYINDLLYKPSPHSPYDWWPENTELAEWFYKANELFSDSCCRIYEKWFKKYKDRRPAMDSLIAFIHRQKIVKIRKIHNESLSSIQICYDYKRLDMIKNPPPRLIEVYSDTNHAYSEVVFLGFDSLWSYNKAGRPSHAEILKSEYRQMRDELADEMLLNLCYGSKGNIGQGKGRGAFYVQLMKNILSQPISDHQMKLRFMDIFSMDSMQSQYIILNKDGWIKE